VRSRRLRGARQSSLLDDAGARIRVYELHGDLTFGTTEIVLAELMQDMATADFFVLDLKRTFSIDEASSRLLTELASALMAGGKRIFFTHTDNKYAFNKHLHRHLKGAQVPDVLAFPGNDLALEWCENAILAAAPGAGGVRAPREVALESQLLLRGLEPAEFDWLRERLQALEFVAGQAIVSRGDASDKIYFLTGGEVSVSLQVGRKQARLATLSAGMAFGEMALIEDGQRTADVSAATDVSCLTLNREALHDAGDPVAREVQRKLLHNVARMLARNLHMAYAEIRALS